MRFKQFLKEELELSLDDAVKRIARDCQPFLNSANDVPAFRGINEIVIDDVDCMFFSHPTLRKPKDSGRYFNFMFNAMFQLAFGEELVRTKSLFMTGDKSAAQEYGTPCFVFPAGKLEFYWSEKIHDSFMDDHFFTLKLNKAGIGSSTRPDNVRTFFGRIADRFLPSEWIKDSQGSAAEITQTIFDGSFNRDERIYSGEHSAYELTKTTLEKIAKDFYKRGDSVEEALKSHNEILVTRSSGYYAIPIEIVRSHLMELNDGQRPDEDETYEYLLQLIDGHVQP